jgi:CRP-like cAMP-binding protein
LRVPRQSEIKNKLLALLPTADFDELANHLQYVELPRGTRLADVGEPIDYVYFMSSGIGALVARSPNGHQAEAGIFGFDGHIPTSAATEVELSSHDVTIQLAGDGHRMGYAAFRKLMNESMNFRRVMLRSIEAFSVQLTHTALSNAVHDVDQRLGRWLLMCHDRVSGYELSLTHELISLMLSVRRPSVTAALHKLEGRGFIKTERGIITIRNRAALEEFAQDAYGRPEQEYQRLMKGLF